MADRGSTNSFCDPQPYGSGGGMSMVTRQRGVGNGPPLKFDRDPAGPLPMMPPPHQPLMGHYNNSNSNNLHRMNANATAFFNSSSNNNVGNNMRNWSNTNNPNGDGSGSAGGSGGSSHMGLMSPKSGGPMYFNFSRQQRYTTNEHMNNRPYMNVCHGNTSSIGGNTIGGGGGGGQIAPYYHHGNQPHNTSVSAALNTTGDSGFSSLSYDTELSNSSLSLNGSSNSSNGSSINGSNCMGYPPPVDTSVTLQLSNIDASIEDRALKNYLIGKLKPITPILSFAYEGMSMVKIRLPSMHHAKQVVAYLHRKKLRHKRISVSYTSTLEPSTLRCQVAGLLKDIPLYKLSMYKFRELFQSRFKTSISVMDLYDMKDICTITENANEEKFICLRPELVNSIENSELLGCLQLSVPYCTDHFKNGQRGWAELEIEPLPNVMMSVSEVRSIIYALLKNHKGDIPIASLVYCIETVVNVRIEKNELGVNLEHLISCVNGIQIATNKFGIKILSWLGADHVQQQQQLQLQQMQQQQQANMTIPYGFDEAKCGGGGGSGVVGGVHHYTKFANVTDPFGQISREIIELIKMWPKSMMKFSRFIPAYHNHFGKQCRVADYGYTKLIELFEALTDVIQVMGDGENRHITLTHKCQVRCFTSDMLRLLRSQPNKSVLMSHVEAMFSSHMGRKFDVTDYGVCKLEDIMESLIRNNVVQVESDPHGDDMLISIPKRRQSRVEMLKTCTFAGEVVDLLKTASQYSISFEKIACSYQFVYGYQCRLNDYGFSKLTDLMEAITGVVEIEMSSNEDRKVYLSPKVAQRVFSEQLRDITKMMTGSSMTPMSLGTLLHMHKKQFGYQMQPQSLGLGYSWYTAVNVLPYIEMTTSATNDGFVVICHHEDAKFKFNSYAACRVILELGNRSMPIANFINAFFGRFSQILNENAIKMMGHAVTIIVQNDTKSVCISPTMMYVLRMVSVLETMNMVTIADFKTILNIGVTDCFRFGYPNFNSLIQSFPDVFLCSAGPNEHSEVVLNKQCILVQNGVQNYFRGVFTQNLTLPPPPFPPPAAPAIAYLQPWLPGNPATAASGQRSICMAEKLPALPPPSLPPPKVEVHNTNNNNIIYNEPPPILRQQQQQQQQMSSNDTSFASKDDSSMSTMSNGSSDGDFDESELLKYYTQPEYSPRLVEVNPEQKDIKRFPLYERKPSTELDHTEYNNQSTMDAKKSRIDMAWNLNTPNKTFELTATSSNNTNKNRKEVPFWMDPVWAHESPNKGPIEIPMPELRILDNIPSLDSSPKVMEDIFRRHPNMFTFET